MTKSIGKIVEIGDDVLVGKGVKIGKSAKIPNNSMISCRSVIKSKFHISNTIIGGNPACVLRENVKWDRLTPNAYRVQHPI